MTVHGATLTELTTLGDEARDSVEGQRALNLAAVLDDRAGIQAGGVASTDKQLGALMAEIRERYARPEGASKLELLQGGGAA